MSKPIPADLTTQLRRLFRPPAPPVDTSSTSAPYNDPLGLNECSAVLPNDHPDPPPLPVPTGLTDEEDAARYMALRFNPDAGFCPNCEGVYESQPYDRYCPICIEPLQPLSEMKPRRRKFIP